MLSITAMVTLAPRLTAPAVSPQPQKPMAPTAPGIAGDPLWQAVVRMSDGRTFITDGGLAIDSAVAKPTRLPERELPGKVMEGYISVPHRDQYGVGDLDVAASRKGYTTPNGIALNSTFVNYLRCTLPRSARFRTTDKHQLVVVVSENKVVCVLMPVAQP